MAESFHPIIDINDAYVLLYNGAVHSIHRHEVSAIQHAYAIHSEWKEQEETGSDARAPKLAILTFPTWEKMNASLPF
jgi:hypothetical protein